MDRNIVYPGSIPLDTDLLTLNKNAMVAIGALAAATLGSATVVDGLAVTPTSPAALGVSVGPGSITQSSPVDATAYGSLAADTTDTILKVGINLAPVTLSMTAPGTTGQAITYLVEASFQEQDVNPVVLPYYNAANPSQPFAGSGNNGIAQPTARVQRAQVQLKAGVAAPSGTQAAPAPDAGWVGLATVTVAFGQTQVTAANIAPVATAPTLSFKLPNLRPGFSAQQVFTSSGGFTVPAGVATVRATVIGGGGSGGYHNVLPSGGGGAAGQAIRIVTGLVPGTVIPITVGAGGAALGAFGNGSNGATSSFGPYVSATGGNGGGGGTVLATCAGGVPGSGAGGDVNVSGSYGGDGIPVAQRGGDGGGPGNGRGTSGQTPGLAALGFGGGGGGGGASQPNGAGTGAAGGAGGPGLVIVEY